MGSIAYLAENVVSGEGTYSVDPQLQLTEKQVKKAFAASSRGRKYRLREKARHEAAYFLKTGKYTETNQPGHVVERL